MPRGRKKTKKVAGQKRQRQPAKESVSRPKKYKQWTDESMQGALKAVAEGMGVNRAALEYGVPRTTLKDRVAGRVQHGCKSGRSPYLTLEEEQELVDYLITCSDIGYPKRRDEVIGIVRKTLQNKRGNLVEKFNGKGWWLRFMERWPKLALRKGDALAQPRANAVTETNVHQYYSPLEKTMQENDILNCPSRVYNMDESGMPLDHKPPKVVVPKGTKKVHCRTSGNKAQITILACGNAAGYVIPPMVIFEGKRLNPEWTKGEVPNTLYGMSEKGWTDMELFHYWMTNLFIPNIPPARPVLLLLDGHSSHYEPDTIRIAQNEGIVVLCLPPHTTHVSQPLDVSFFRPLKAYWSDACHKYMQDNPGRVVTKYQFSALFSQAWYKAIKPDNIISGFQKAGICPFNPKAVAAPPPLSSVGESASESHGQSSSNSILSREKHELFTTRFENGYDIYTDEEYVAWLNENHPESIPSEICLKSDNVDSMDDSDMEEMDIFTYARSDPYDPFELAYPMDEREQNHNEIEDHTMEDDPYFLIESSIVTPLVIAGDFSPPFTSASDLTSLSITATCSSHVTSPLNGSDLTSPSVADTYSNHVTPPSKSSDLTSPSITATCSSHVTSPVNASDLTSPSIADTYSSHVTPPSKSSDLTFPSISVSCPSQVTSSSIADTCSSHMISAPDAIASASDLVSPSTGLLHVSPLSSATISTSTTLTVTTTPSNSTCTVVSVHPSLTTPDSGVTTPSCAQSSSRLGSTRKVLSPITQFLTYPSVSSCTPKSTKQSTKGSCARVLTSSEAIAIMEAKEKKKQDDIIAKENRKKEREQKKLLREAEAKRKADERERKVIERQRKATERAAERERKAAERKREAQERELKKKAKMETRRTCKRVSNKENKVPIDDFQGLQQAEINQNECAVCLGVYDDDLTDGVLQKEWIRCTNTDTCGLWMHCECLNKDSNDNYVCLTCNTTFA